MTKILDGKIVAEKINADSAILVKKLTEKSVTPKLVIVIGTNNKSLLSYVKGLSKQAEKIGILAEIIEVSETSTNKYEEILNKLSSDPSVHGIILQTPLPDSVDAAALSALVPVDKDVDGINPASAGRLLANEKSFAPATAEAVITMLDYYNIGLSGKNVAVLGRSMIVGKPVASLLINRDATATICHSKTQNLSEITKKADILVVAIGRANLVNADYVSRGQVIVDVGINFNEDGKIVGDVDFNNVEAMTSAISPVPGGVGPVTAALLLKHTCEAALSTL
ncbi:bifunctional 5,10-methylene-tetrahydrofolate dehydrogenase/5,10-methylene-tetrahydrofolate cyclohydrolase [Candidatus Saccharibacteria bacterium]|nr:bifunctional 5,10-methylene-tetrahydrofolate dehydrogenase/5,10-methylene-tetrahydrofolate cyclohydrolase [Candidatus Saccharibacteria bacterium]